MTQHRVPHVVAALSATSASRPDAVVLDDGERTVTAQELVGWAGGVADQLDGIATGDITVVLADRRVASVAAVFGVRWAGSALAVLDPNEPRARLRELVERIRPVRVIDATGTVDGDWFGHQVVRAGDVKPAFVEPTAVAPDALGLLVFTSGSTGRPKGVARRVDESDAQFEQVRMRNDSSSTAVFLPLQFIGGFGPATYGPAIGHRSILIDPRATSMDRIAERIDEAAIEKLSITPSLGRLLAQTMDGRRMESVAVVNAVGEPSDWADVALIRSITSPRMVYKSGYGASEALRSVVQLEIPPDEPIGVGRVRLGRLTEPAVDRLEPVDGTDDVFEVIVRRDVVDGYWDDPVLTTERFGVDDDGVRFWRSGDLVSVDEAGVVHLRGRADDMVKVNGRLVEPAEAERVIRAVPGVRAAVVIPRTLESGRQQLVGHVEAEAHVSADSVRATLSASLPPALAPAVLVRHEQLPLGDRGKVDRQLLRTAAVNPWRDDVGDGPTTPLERSITEIVARCLDVSDLASSDDLWAVGCDSLAAVEIAQAISVIHDAAVEANDLISSPTPRAIAARLSNALPRDHDGVIVANASGSLPPLHFVAGAGAPAVQYHSLALSLGPDQPVVVYEQAGLHRRWPIDLTVDAAARRHVEVLMRRWPHGRVVLAGHSYGGVVANRMASVLAESGRDVELIVLDAGLPTRWRAFPSPGRGGMDLRRVRAYIRLRLANTRKWVRVLSARPGTVKRYNAMIVPAALQLALHRGVEFAGRTTVVVAAERTDRLRWTASDRVTFVKTPGDHNSMLKQPHVGALAELITEVLANTNSESAPIDPRAPRAAEHFRP